MYYIDFDNTIYETGKLTKDVLISFSKIIVNEKGLNKETVLEDLKKGFNSTTDNFVSYASKLSEKYFLDNALLENALKTIIIENGNSYVFPDAIEFLKKLKAEGEHVCLLTYVANNENVAQQLSKLEGSGIIPFIKNINITTTLKYKLLDIDYKNGIFVDDSPRDLEGLYQAGATHIYRMIRPNNEKRTSKPVNIPDKFLKTVTSFDDILKDIEIVK